jgi:hypothetical protein
MKYEVSVTEDTIYEIEKYKKAGKKNSSKENP